MRRARSNKIPDSNITIILAASALLAGLYFSQQIYRPSQPKLSHATLYPSDFRKLVDFKLVDHNGKPFTQDQFLKQWSMIFFGFTSCPDVCPTTLAALNQVYTQISKEHPDMPLQVILITADPERDTPAQLKSYLEYFNPSFLGLSGDEATLKKVAKYFGVFTAKVENPDEPENYTIDHGAAVILLSPKAQPYALFSAPHTPQAMIQDLSIIAQNY